MIVGVMSNDERHAHMAAAVKLFPMMRKRERIGFSDRKISIVCYGPSLNDTWKDIKGPILTVSGAHDYLREKGVTPAWHVDCDPRIHKALMLKRPSINTLYLMASCCHPQFWKTLKGYNVKLWHLINGNDLVTPTWIREHHPEGLDCMMGGGSTVGMRALEVACAMGFRRFDIHGMDCSFKERRHAGAHGGNPQAEIIVKAGERAFKTTPQMYEAAREMEQFIRNVDADVSFHGDGLMQETARLVYQQKRAA